MPAQLIQFIHITAAYSNAVLAVVLPHVSDFAQKLDLPVPQPITAAQVAHFTVSPIKEQMGGGLWLTNHYQFSFNDGYVTTFNCLNDNPWLVDDPGRTWPRFAGVDHMTTNDAIEMARDTLCKLGYDPKLLHADGPPLSIEGPDDLHGYHIPYCKMYWENGQESNLTYVEFEINMNKKKVVGIGLIGRSFWRPEPQIDVVPELEADYRKRTHPKMFIRTNAPSHYFPQTNPQPGAASPSIQTNSPSP